jgi:hypothetical protein
MLLDTLQQGLSETVRYVAMMHAARLKPNDPGVIANLNAVAECSHSVLRATFSIDRCNMRSAVLAFQAA